MGFQDLVNLMDRLRAEKGCPWDKKQTLDSLKPFLIEETYEVIEAIENSQPEKLREELGDLLFHILFMSKVSADEGTFDIEDVIRFVYEKMRRRHPHVFGPVGAQLAVGDSQADKAAPDALKPAGLRAAIPKSGGSQKGSDAAPQDADEVLERWYEIKQQERDHKGISSLMDGIPRHLPALQKAQKVQRRAAQVGFDWEKAEDVLEKISEEMAELSEAISRRREDDIAEEVGDLLFSVVNVCRFLDVDAEDALRGTIAKFTERFREMERRVATGGSTLRDLSLEEMDTEWEAVKAKGKRTSEDKA